MKTLLKHFIISVFIIGGVAIVFSTCKKDTDCSSVITVKSMSNPNIVIPNAKVFLHYGNVLDSGISDVNGQYRHTFNLEAILRVDAILYKTELDSLKVDSMDSYSGKTLIQLTPGKTTNQTVLISLK